MSHIRWCRGERRTHRFCRHEDGGRTSRGWKQEYQESFRAAEHRGIVAAHRDEAWEEMEMPRWRHQIRYDRL